MLGGEGHFLSIYFLSSKKKRGWFFTFSIFFFFSKKKFNKNLLIMKTKNNHILENKWIHAYLIGSMTSPHKKNRKPHKKKSLQNAMTTSHEYRIITFKCYQNT
jgi:hypothetical protein